MEFKSKYDLGQEVYYLEYINDRLTRLKSPIKAVLVEGGILNQLVYVYLVDKNQWKYERELCDTEEELELKYEEATLRDKAMTVKLK